MWVPKMKFLSGLFARSGLFTLPNGGSYEGPYHQNELGQFRTGDSPSPDSQVLIENPEELTDDQIQELEFFSSIENLPTPEDYKTGYMNRYFLKNTITNKIIEVDENFYNKDSRSQELYIQKLIIKWIISKPVKDIFNQGYVFEGAATRNQKAVIKANLEMKGIINYIVNYSQFADIESDVEGYKFEELPEPEQYRIIKQSSSNIQQGKKPDLVKDGGGGKRDGGGIKFLDMNKDSDGDGIFDFENDMSPLGGPTGDNEPTGSRRSGGGGSGRSGGTGESYNISNVYRY